MSRKPVVALTITDDLNKRISLHKINGEWVLPDASDHLAQAAKITPVN